MRKLVWWSAVAFGVIALAAGGHVSTSAGNSFARLSAVSAQGATRFTSAYTTLTKCGSGMTRKEEKAAEENGSDIPTRCKGYGGYDVYIYYSACSSNFMLDKGDEDIPLGMQAVDWKQKTVEWRMANGKPFAIIMRVFHYAGDNECGTGGKITGESLRVRGLKGYEHIDESVAVKGDPNANVKARELADKGFAKPKG
ncbi:MAG: hypothetical protein AABM67_20215 [Acidobacteriota bacterium]